MLQGCGAKFVSWWGSWIGIVDKNHEKLTRSELDHTLNSLIVTATQQVNNVMVRLKKNFNLSKIIERQWKWNNFVNRVAIAFAVYLRNVNANGRPIEHHPYHHWWQRGNRSPILVPLPLFDRLASSGLKWKDKRMVYEASLHTACICRFILPSNSASSSEALDSWAIFFLGMTRKWTGACAKLQRKWIYENNERKFLNYRWYHGRQHTAIRIFDIV